MSEVRPSKKQRELLSFIDGFIKGHGYGPSYREIMRGLDYKSVSTVATHIDNLIAKGHLRKRDRSARSLEVTTKPSPEDKPNPAISKTQHKWLVDSVQAKFAAVEKNATASQKEIDDLYVLVGAIYILGMDDAARAFKARLASLSKK